MYLQHFGLSQHPFSLTPNTRFFLKLPAYQEAFNSLVIALNDNEGFIKVTGEVGVGKTMLCRKVLNALECHKKRYVTAFIPHPYLSPEGLLNALVEELKIKRVVNSRYHDLLGQITTKLTEHALEKKRAILFVDEAQAMPRDTMETLRQLTNIETREKMLLQVVLFGQPELDERLQQPSLRQLKQRITYSYHLKPLDCNGIRSYVMHRLTTAGFNGPELFTSKAIKLLHKSSRGIPRLVNIITHKAMMSAFGKGDLVINKFHIESAILDTEDASVPILPLPFKLKVSVPGFLL